MDYTKLQKDFKYAIQENDEDRADECWIVAEKEDKKEELLEVWEDHCRDKRNDAKSM